MEFHLLPGRNATTPIPCRLPRVDLQGINRNRGWGSASQSHFLWLGWGMVEFLPFVSTYFLKIFIEVPRPLRACPLQKWAITFGSLLGLATGLGWGRGSSNVPLVPASQGWLKELKQSSSSLMPKATVILHYAGDNEGSVDWLWLSQANVTQYCWKDCALVTPPCCRNQNWLEKGKKPYKSFISYCSRAGVGLGLNHTVCRFFISIK